ENPSPVTIHTRFERFNKQNPHSFDNAAAPKDAENRISQLEKILIFSRQGIAQFPDVAHNLEILKDQEDCDESERSGKKDLGECRHATRNCFKRGQTGHLQQDGKKDTAASTSGHADKETRYIRLGVLCYYAEHQASFIGMTLMLFKILKKARYGLKQALRVWDDMLSSFLLSQEFSKGAVDPTLFTKKEGKDILMGKIYVDDIIFAYTDPSLCDIMSFKFKMSMMGKMSFFLGLQISQSPRGIFINQTIYALEILKKYGMDSSDSVDTPMVEQTKLDEDLQGKIVDPTHYRRMIGSRMYLTSSRPDLVFSVCIANERSPMLEKGNYIPWESRFRRFLDNKLKDGERMWNSIQNGPYQRPMIPNPDNTQLQILEPLSKMNEGNKKQYIADVRVMNYLFHTIPNDIYNSVDACKNAKEMW
ncbi:retrovirus-related pol polyprotein from transposon TNT 1-94, partial [Tanacetum coccineum]